MKASRAVMVAGVAAVMITAGGVAAPESGEAVSRARDVERAEVDDARARRMTVDGPVVTNMRGDYQARLHIEAGSVVEVEFPIAGTDAAQSRHINSSALPILEERILEAQSADVEYVSGASYTSPAMIESAQQAFDEAGL